MNVDGISLGKVDPPERATQVGATYNTTLAAGLFFAHGNLT